MGETTRIENNEYGYCSLIKATKRVLEKLEIENKTAATITPVERIETPLWLYNQRAEYGKQVVKNLAKNSLYVMVLVGVKRNSGIVSATQRQLTWTHLKNLMYIKNPLEHYEKKKDEEASE